jgi:predicted MFS family arabinose efflux permease
MTIMTNDIKTTPSHAPGLVGLLMLGIAVVGSNSLALSPILGDVARDLGTGPVAVARANAAYGGATALSALTLGPLIDRHGHSRALVAGLAGLCVAMLASAAATHWAWLTLAQGAAGAAAGIVLPATYALATAAVPRERSAETLGRVLSGWAISMVAGVPISAAIAEAFSWRASYGLFAILLAIAAALLFRQPAVEAPTGPRMALRAVMVRRDVGPLLAVCLLFMTAFYGVYTYLGDHLRLALGIGAAQAGLVVLAYGAGFGLGALADRVVDRFGAARALPLVLGALAPIYLAMVPASAGLPWILALVTLWGFVQHLGLTILVLALTRTAPEARGAVLALNSATAYLGALAGAWGLGLLYDHAGFDVVTVAAAACLCTAAATARLSRRERDGDDGVRVASRSRG